MTNVQEQPVPGTMATQWLQMYITAMSGSTVMFLSKRECTFIENTVISTKNKNMYTLVRQTNKTESTMSEGAK